jgi:hypothetical protein
VYIFSIFLYYSCVKHPEQYFQQCCSKLDGNNQSIITKFFCQLVEHQCNLNKDAIRGAIQQASKCLNLKYWLVFSKVFFFSVPLLMPPFMSIDSPIKTPQAKQSPPTPTTVLLDEKKRTNNLLQSQLESERFERGYLEMQLKQSEEKVEKLGKTYCYEWVKRFSQ